MCFIERLNFSKRWCIYYQQSAISSIFY